MKKKSIIKSTATLAILSAGLTVGLYSCKKEKPLQPQTPTNAFNLSVAENPTDGTKAMSLSGTRLVFPSAADYQAAIDNPTLLAETSLMTTINSFPTFISWNEKFVNDNLFPNRLFSTILNGDGVVQIGNNIFRVDKTFEKVFVLPVADIAYYYDLVSTYPQTGKVFMFNTENEVLEWIQAGALNQTVVTTMDLLPPSALKGLFKINIKLPKIGLPSICSESNAGPRHDSKPFFERNLTLKTDYNANGIEFNLSASTQASGAAAFMFQFTGGMGTSKGYIGYHAKCAQTVGTELSTDGTRTLYLQQYMVYRAAKGLNKYYLGCRMVNKTTSAAETAYSIIRVNM